eukprot:scaffold12647_cov40-Cyclotella_meneghiniana.AAC.4
MVMECAWQTYISMRSNDYENGDTVLDVTKKTRQTVTWDAAQNRVSSKNGKVRQRHLELVIARVMRDRAAAAAA